MVLFYFLLLLSPLAVNVFFNYQIMQGMWFHVEYVLWALILLAGLI